MNTGVGECTIGIRAQPMSSHRCLPKVDLPGPVECSSMQHTSNASHADDNCFGPTLEAKDYIKVSKEYNT